MSLKEYKRKRHFEKTPEPSPKVKTSAKGKLTFVIQKHAASRTHYDFRLELDGVLKSWAVPKGPTLTSGDPRLAVQVEDHPIKYGSFEGVIPKGNYGAGTVMIWDSGHYVERGSQSRKDSEKALKAGMEKGHITFLLEGKKLSGEFALVKIKKKGAPDNGWLLIKKHDESASRHDILKEDRSSETGRTMDEIAQEARDKGEVWLPGKGKQKAEKKIAPRPKTEKRLPSEVKASLPRKVRPMQPLFSKDPKETGWIYEPFGEGIRAIAEKDSNSVKLYSKIFLPLDKKYPQIVSALKKWKSTAVFDGEIVKEGKSVTYRISDLLFFEGKDLREAPLKERKKILSQLSLEEPLSLAPTSDTAEAMNSRLIVAKRLDSPYHSGLTKDWVQFHPQTSSKTEISRDKPPLTHLKKVYWPKEGYTKGDLVEYYDSISRWILPHLKDRPESLHRQPDGIKNQGFFHKDITGFLPRRIETVKIYSASSAKTINYVLCQDRWSLLYLVNLGCIELNPWLSKREDLERPDYVVIDLDPDDNDFSEVIQVAQEFHRLFEKIGAKSFCKTSGASGLHICIPTGAKFEFETGRLFAEAACQYVHQKFPKFTSIERTPAKRRGKIYLDFLQNRRGQTLAAPYCVRPRPGATVSTPLKWSEVKTGLNPKSFTIRTIHKRLSRVGDLWAPMLENEVNLEACMKRLSKLLHI